MVDSNTSESSSSAPLLGIRLQEGKSAGAAPAIEPFISFGSYPFPWKVCGTRVVFIYFVRIQKARTKIDS